MKYITKLHNNKWCIFLRTGNAKKHTDVLCADEYSGTFHTACIIAENLTNDLKREQND